MATTQEYNQFRRLIGAGSATPTVVITTTEIDSYLNDTVLELTGSVFATPLNDFDTLVEQYHREVIYKAAINWWWNELAELQSKHSIQVGVTSQNVGEKWDRAWQMIQSLQATYDQIQALWQQVTIGNFSRYSKQTLRRIGGVEEENTNA